MFEKILNGISFNGKAQNSRGEESIVFDISNIVLRYIVPPTNWRFIDVQLGGVFSGLKSFLTDALISPCPKL